MAFFRTVASLLSRVKCGVIYLIVFLPRSLDQPQRICGTCETRPGIQLLTSRIHVWSARPSSRYWTRFAWLSDKTHNSLANSSQLITNYNYLVSTISFIWYSDFHDWYTDRECIPFWKYDSTRNYHEMLTEESGVPYSNI